MSANLEYYKIFYYVAKYRSFTRAAEILVSSQPSVSRTIKMLEQDLNCTLFTRTQKGVTLTPEGVDLYQHIRVAYEEILAGEETVKRECGLEEGSIYMGANETALHCFLFEQLESFRQKYPAIKLRIQSSTTPDAMHMLKERAIELAVVSGPVEAEHKMRKTAVGEFQDILIGGPRFRQLARRTLRLEALTRYPLILLSRGTKTRDFYEDFFQQYGLSVEPDIEVASADLILPMVIHNLGIGFLPREIARPELEKGTVVELQLEEDIPPRKIFLLENLERKLSVAAEQLKEMITRQKEE